MLFQNRPKDYTNFRNWETGATRTLFIGNLDRDFHDLLSVLRDLFSAHGRIDSLDLKTPREMPAYAFCQFHRIAEAASAKDSLNNRVIGRTAIRIGWGKVLGVCVCMCVAFGIVLALYTSMHKLSVCEHICVCQ